ncbi:MAG: type II toxin-antitoxin system Phd/YefM family antitoxin [Chloroflexota bacterium]
MTLIGVRELRQQTAAVLRQVREQKMEYVITYQGRPVALLLPVDTAAVETAMIQAGKRSATAQAWETYARLAAELRQKWPPGLETQTLLDDIRQR